MKHKLPLIKNLILKDYKFIEVITFHTKNIFNLLQHTLNSYLFCKQGEQLHYLNTSSIESLSTYNDLPWQKSTFVSLEAPVNTIISEISKYGAVLIEESNGQPIGYIDSNSLLKKIYFVYQHLEAYFETLIQTTDASISIIDEHCKTMVWTKGAEQIFSIKEEEIIGKDMTEHFPVEMLQAVKTLQTGESVYRRQHQPRQDLFVLINSNPIKINNKIVGAVAAETDITSQVRLNQELFNVTTKVQHLEQEMAKLKPSIDPFRYIKGTSQAINRTKDKLKKIGATKATSLIYGESGVGKELFAKALHEISEPVNAPFVPINCGAIPSSLFESELFGYEKGAFSGADQKGKKGKVELAKNGTLFLDEIGELPQDVQVKLLRLLQEKKILPGWWNEAT